MRAMRGWTGAGSPDTMRVVYHHSSRQGTGHAIVAPSHRLVVANRRRARPPLRPTPVCPLPRSPVRQGTTHRHLLVSRRRRQRRLPTRLPRPVGRRTTRRVPGLPPARLRPAAAAAPAPRRSLALRHRRHAHGPVRPLRPGRRRPSPPFARPSRREVRLRPYLGHPRLAGPSSAVAHPVLAPPRLALRPRQGRAPTGQGLPLGVPHQAGTGRRLGPLAEGVVGPCRQGLVAGRRRRLRQAALPAASPGVGTGAVQPAAQGRRSEELADDDAPTRATWAAAHLWQGQDRPGQTAPATGVVGGRCSACSTASR